MKRFFAWLVGLCLAAYAGVALFIAAGQDRLIFRVDPQRPDLAATGLARAKDTELVTRDGVKLTGWEIAPAGPHDPVYVYFHGNARTLERRTPRFRLLTESGAGLIAFHYRGYGGSTGAPSEDALHTDAAAIFQEALRRYPGQPLILFGESLGASVATHLAAKVSARALVLDSPFSSMVSMAEERYPWLPVRLLLRHHFRSDRAITDVRMPVLILHGERDGLIPIAEAERLYGLAPDPRRFVRYPGAGHVAVFQHGALADIQRFLREVAALGE